MQTQQKSQKDISEIKLSKGQLGGGINKMNAENSKNWREDAKGKNKKIIYQPEIWIFMAQLLYGGCYFTSSNRVFRISNRVFSFQ